MNKVVVGHAPSPNLMKVQSRIGSLANNDHKVGQLFIGRKFSQESLVKKVQWQTPIVRLVNFSLI